MEKLQGLLEQPDSDKKILRLFKPLTDTDRRALVPMCLKWFRKQKSNAYIEKPRGTFRTNPLVNPAAVAVFCVGNYGDIKKLSHWLPSNRVMLEVLIVRRPDWTESLVQQFLNESRYWNEWSLIRSMVANGLCEKPDHPRYYTGMITSLSGTNALTQLKKNPDLLKDDIWRLFEYEGDGDNTLANVDRWESGNWSGAMVTLSKTGKLSRPRLLDSALSALELGFNHYRSKWFYDLFDKLDPTKKELKQRSEKILNLLGSPIPNIAKWAFNKYEVLMDEGLVKDHSQLTQSLSPLLSARGKGTVLSALKRLTKLAQTSPAIAKEASLLATDALGHEKADVQKGALKFISTYGSPQDRDLVLAVEKYAPVVAASLRKPVQQWIQTASTTPTAKSPQTGSKTKSPKKTAAKNTAAKKFDRRRLKEFDKTHIELLQVEPLIAALESCDDNAVASVAIPAATFDGTDIPRLDPQRKLTPIQDFEELLATLGRAIEDTSLIDDGERAVDGLTRLGHDKPADFEKLIAPLVKRALQLMKRGACPLAGQSLRADLCGMIMSWQSGQPVKISIRTSQHGTQFIEHDFGNHKDEAWDQSQMPLVFMSRRSLEICQRMAAATPFQLLSVPTHEGGWIAPTEFVRRVNQLTADPNEADLVLALLRLAPDGRPSALKKLKSKLKGEWINAVQHALGANAVRIGKTASLWVAAARCRSPWQDDSKVTKSFPKLGPGCGDAAKYKIRYWLKKYSFGTQRYLAVETTQALPKKRETMLPTQLMQLNRGVDSVSFHDLGTEAGSIRWLATLWPAAFGSYFAAGAQCLGDNLDWHEAAWHNRCFMEPLLEPDTPLRDMGTLLLLCGLAAKEPGEHGLATDIAIQAINDGRLGTDNLMATLRTHIPEEHYSLPRLAKRFHDVASASDLHAYVCMVAWEDSLASLLAGDPKKLPRGFGDLLELLGELGAHLGKAIINTDCRVFLEQITGSNKAAKAARKLLAMESTFDSAPIIESAISNRLERLQLWSKR